MRNLHNQIAKSTQSIKGSEQNSNSDGKEYKTSAIDELREEMGRFEIN